MWVRARERLESRHYRNPVLHWTSEDMRFFLTTTALLGHTFIKAIPPDRSAFLCMNCKGWFYWATATEPTIAAALSCVPICGVKDARS